MGAIALEIANGAAGGAEAFVAHVLFRDKDGRLVLPPYADFATNDYGLAIFAVSGGEAAAPALTLHGYTAPEGAAFLDVELRSGRAGMRPLLVRDPILIGGEGVRIIAGSATHPPRMTIDLRDGTQELEIATANGAAAAAKAFAATLHFFDGTGAEIPGPYAGFQNSPRLGSYFYVRGGSQVKPGITRHDLVAPRGAVRLDLVFHPWNHTSSPSLQIGPLRLPVSDNLSGKSKIAAQGTRILETLGIAPPDGDIHGVIGLFGSGLITGLGGRVVNAALPFDSYDRVWAARRPAALVIEVDHLVHCPGWRHALTLRDPAATLELAVMLEKARAGGIRTVLVPPRQRHRFPMLSRVTSLFDLTLTAEEVAARFA